MKSKSSISQKNKNKIPNNNKGVVVWLTGLPCSGKTTVGEKVYHTLKNRGVPVEHLDGDVIRKKMHKNFGFSKKDRQRHLMLVADLAKSLNDKGNIVLASFVSPYREQRDKIRKKIKNFIEVFVDAPLEVCEKRDVKGMYQRARRGEIDNFTGISDPYEKPLCPEITLMTHNESVAESANKVIGYLRANGYLK